MNIQIRSIPNDDILALAGQLDGLHIQTCSTDINGRVVSGAHFRCLTEARRSPSAAAPEG